MRPGLWIDLALCIAVLPALLLIFPIEDWAGWDSMYVLGLVFWLYFNYFLHRRVSSPLMLSGSRWRWTSAALVFISAAITFLISLHQIGEPGFETAPRLDAHQQALWVLYIVTTFCGLAIGVLDVRLRQLETDRAIRQQKNLVTEEIEFRSDEAVAGESLSVKVGYQSVQLPVSDIQYIESRGNYACITLKALAEMLPEGKFLRVHRSFLIPSWRIQSHGAGTVRLIGVSREIPVGRAHKENLK